MSCRALPYQDAYRAGGFRVQVNGVQRKLLPLVPIIGADGKEARLLSLTKDSWETRKPCFRCLTPKAAMPDTNALDTYGPRDPAAVYEELDHVERDETYASAAKAALDELSVHGDTRVGPDRMEWWWWWWWWCSCGCCCWWWWACMTNQPTAQSTNSTALSCWPALNSVRCGTCPWATSLRAASASWASRPCTNCASVS